jgi:hypothetical protein
MGGNFGIRWIIAQRHQQQAGDAHDLEINSRRPEVTTPAESAQPTG